MGTLHHVSMKIERALSFTDDELSDLFDGSGAEIRKELTERKNNGEILIPSEGCEGFNVITGCPGHKN